MKGYREATVSLADRSERTVLAAREMLDDATFIPTAAGAVGYLNQAAVALADVALSLRLNQLTLGLKSPDDPARLEASFATLLERIKDDDPGSARAKLARLSRAEPLSTGRRAFQEGMRRHGVKGWTRQAAPGACALCTSLADGTVLSTDTPIVDHPGCSCVAVPVEGEAD